MEKTIYKIDESILEIQKIVYAMRNVGSPDSKLSAALIIPLLDELIGCNEHLYAQSRAKNIMKNAAPPPPLPQPSQFIKGPYIIEE